MPAGHLVPLLLPDWLRVVQVHRARPQERAATARGWVYLNSSLPLASPLPAGDERNSHKQSDGHKRDRVTAAAPGTHSATKSLCASSLLHRHASLFASLLAVRFCLRLTVALPARQHILIM